MANRHVRSFAVGGSKVTREGGEGLDVGSWQFYVRAGGENALESLNFDDIGPSFDERCYASVREKGNEGVKES